MKILSISHPPTALAQLAASFEAIKELRPADYDIALFPELVVGGYHVRDLWLSSDYLRLCDKALSSIAQLQRQWHGSEDRDAAPLWVVGAPQQIEGRRHNAAFVLQRGEVTAVYHKRSLARTGVFEEHRYFDAGRRLCCLERRGVRIGLMICEDIWVEDVIGDYAKEGVELMLVLNASPFEVDKQHRREQRVSLLSKRFRLPFVLSNLCGAQDELSFDGIAYAYKASGELAQRSAFFGAGASALDFSGGELGALDDPAIVPLPGANEQLERALVLALREYLRANGLGQVVIGLSGGIDSAVCLCLAVEAAGAENVEGLMIVGPHTSELSIELANELAEINEVKCRSVDIGSAYQGLLQLMRRIIPGKVRDIVKENLQARLRSSLLAGLANQKNALLLNTSNKSESTLGYGTLYGDLAGGVGPLLDVTKGGVYQLAQHFNRFETRIPKGIISRAPTAELAPNQTDEAALMPYHALESLLHYHLGLGLEFSELRRLAGSAMFTKDQGEMFISKAVGAEYKRRQSAMALKVSPYTYIVDRRYPLSPPMVGALLQDDEE